jgi:hypothetical protein
MQHPLTMRVVDRVADLAGVVERPSHRERAFSRQDVFQRLTRDELHHDEEDVVLLLRGQDGDDVRVVEAREQARLAQQLAKIDALLVRNLEGDPLVDPRVFGKVDRAETAAANRRQDLVFTDDLAAEKHRGRV